MLLFLFCFVKGAAQTTTDCFVENPLSLPLMSMGNCTPDPNYSYSTDPNDLAAFPL